MIRRQLKGILIDMIEQVNDNDTEKAHVKADDLLVELVETIVDYTGVYESEIKDILKQYQKVGKWYA